MKSFCAALLVTAGLFAAGALADTGEEVVKARCSLCHDGGAGGAPKTGNRTDWEPRAARGKLALYEVALRGKPNTAMMARGGFRDLSTDEVRSAVDYMVAQAGLQPGLHPEAPPARPTENLAPAAALPAAEIGGAAVAAALPGTPPPVAPAAEADDKTITAHIAGALLAQLAPSGARIAMQDDAANVGGLGIRVATREGVVWLRGMVKNAEIIERAEAIAKLVDGVKKVENKLISATIFEWD
jgi:cytochrome c5